MSVFIRPLESWLASHCLRRLEQAMSDDARPASCRRRSLPGRAEQHCDGERRSFGWSQQSLDGGALRAIDAYDARHAVGSRARHQAEAQSSTGSTCCVSFRSPSPFDAAFVARFVAFAFVAVRRGFFAAAFGSPSDAADRA